MAKNDVFVNSIKSVSLGITLQICLRIATFIVNACILRFISRDVLGVINVRLVLLYTSVQFISREAFRRAAISDSKCHSWSRCINVIWLNVPVSLVVGSLFSLIWIFCLHKPDPILIPGYETASIIIPIAVFIEIIAEPAHIFGQLNNFLKLRILIEGISVLTKCTLMIIFIAKCPEQAVYIYCYSQLVSSILYTLLYYLYFYINFRKTGVNFKETFLPRFLNSKPVFNLDLLLLVWSFFKQTIVKQLLTEGEKLVMTFFNPLTFAEQGVYDIINNLSSLPARFIFQPIEESGYILFSQLIDRNKPSNKQKNSDLKSASDILTVLLKIMITFGLIVLFFGYKYSDIVLLVYGGKQLANDLGLYLMRCQCLYVLLIAINGVSECFTFAAMNKVEINYFNKKMVRLSFVFLISAFVLTRIFGSPGFIFANCLNMIGRIIESGIFTRNYYSKTDLSSPFNKEIIPSIWVSASLLVSFLFISLTELFSPNSGFAHFTVRLIVGSIFFLIVFLMFLFKERNVIAFIKHEFQKRKNKTDKEE